MKEFIYYNALFDIYGMLLTDKEQESFRDYYQEDLSLAEIAELKSISRSAVQKIIKTVLEKLDYYEEKLKIYSNNLILKEVLELVEDTNIKSKIEEVLK